MRHYHKIIAILFIFRFAIRKNNTFIQASSSAAGFWKSFNLKIEKCLDSKSFETKNVDKARWTASKKIPARHSTAPAPAPRDVQWSKALLDGWGFGRRMGISWNHIRLFATGQHWASRWTRAAALPARLTRASWHAITIETLTIKEICKYSFTYWWLHLRN